MYFAFFWLDRWVKFLEACDEQQQRLDAIGDNRASADAAELDQLRAVLAEREQAVHNAVREREELQTQIAGLRGELSTAVAERASAQQERDRLQAELSGLRTRAENQQKAHEKRAAELMRAVADAEQRLLEEQQARARAQADAADLRTALAKAEADGAGAHAECRRLQDEITRLRAQADAHRAASPPAAQAAAAPAVVAETAVVEPPVPEPRQVLRPERRSKVEGTRPARRGRSSAEKPQPAASPDPSPAARSSPSGDLVVRFQKPAEWAGAVYVYLWNTDPASEAPEWPGAPMMEEADGWFVYRLQGVRAANLIFNDNEGRQTPNLHRDRSGWFAEDGTWHEECPEAG
jgi:Starch-binding module 26